MAFEDFLNHTCSIYHVVTMSQSPGYGLQSALKHEYADVPDIADIPCHFTQGAGGTANTVIQLEPYKTLEDRIKLILPYGTDVRINDKIIDQRTGYEYTAEIPRTVRNHHVFVYVKRDGIEATL